MIFENIQYDNYVLVETVAPTGYIVGGVIPINNTNFTREKTEIIKDVINRKQRGTIYATKQETGLVEAGIE